MTETADAKTLGQIAFEAHRDFLEGVRPWSDVREPEREVWEATAKAVAEVAGASTATLPARDKHHHLHLTCGACGEEFGTNCDDDDIRCANCGANRCPHCGGWFGED